MASDRSKVGKRSKRKGKVGERQAAEYLRSLGFEVRRAVQYNGAAGDADCIGIPGVFIEVKRDNSVRFGTKALKNALAKAIDQARGNCAVVLFRPDRAAWGLAYSTGDCWFQVTYGDDEIAGILRRLSR